MAFGKSKGTDKSKQTNDSSGSTGVDAGTQNKVDAIWNAAQGAGNTTPFGVDNAQNFYNNAQTYGQQGAAALGGDQASIARYMNPYQQNVIDKMNQQFAQQNQMTSNQISDQATKANAFGGSRHGVAQGVALAQNQMNQGGQIAGLLQSGYNDAMSRAGQSAQMGMDAASAGANLGMTAGSPDLWRLNALKQGFSGMPYGTTYQNRGRQDFSGTTSNTNFGSK